MSGPLDGQVAVVTGGYRGIGLAVSRGLAADGATVVICGRNGEAAATAAAEIGGKAEGRVLDVSDEDAVVPFFKQVVTDHGRIDVLVNNAGRTADTLLPIMKRAQWDAVLDTNLTGCFLCSRAVARPMMKQRGGCVINLSSIAGLRGNPGQANYSAAKAGIIGLTKAMARELGSRGIRVNCVAPGFIDTPMLADLPAGVVDALVPNIPLGRVGDPEDVAAAVRFLATPGARYITGAVLQVDGGLGM